jgi:L-lactate utilization protein LutC
MSDRSQNIDSLVGFSECSSVLFSNAANSRIHKLLACIYICVVKGSDVQSSECAVNETDVVFPVTSHKRKKTL